MAMNSDERPVVTHRPAERLREQLLGGHGRYVIMAGAAFIWLMDALLQRRLASIGLNDGGIGQTSVWLDEMATYVFVLTAIPLLYALLRPLPQFVFRLAAVYLGVAALQVVANVLGMVASAHLFVGHGLSGLWDIAAVYAMSVTVFTFIYGLMDVSTPGGAFVWPARLGEAAPTPNLFDYLFISLNTNSTYGPTTEVVMSRAVKMLMSLQVLLAIVMLTVLIARAAAGV